jgi:hypothetical protein
MTKRVVYLDNAATTPVRPEVLEAMLPYLGKDAFGNPSSAHRFGRAARAGIEAAKRQVAEALGGGAEPNQVVFTSGGTEADNLAIIGAALAARVRGGPFCVAVSATEHKATLAAAHAVKHLGGDEIILPVSASGIVEDAALDAALARGGGARPPRGAGQRDVGEQRGGDGPAGGAHRAAMLRRRRLVSHRRRPGVRQGPRVAARRCLHPPHHLGPQDRRP